MQASKELSVDPTEPNILVEESLTQHLLSCQISRALALDVHTSNHDSSNLRKKTQIPLLKKLCSLLPKDDKFAFPDFCKQNLGIVSTMDLWWFTMITWVCLWWPYKVYRKEEKAPASNFTANGIQKWWSGSWEEYDTYFLLGASYCHPTTKCT